MRDSGILKVYTLENIAAKGDKPVNKLVEMAACYYADKTVGFTRLFAAKGANVLIDSLVRCFNTGPFPKDVYVILEDGLQYRVAAQQVIVEEDAVDLTLERCGENYDVYAG